MALLASLPDAPGGDVAGGIELAVGLTAHGQIDPAGDTAKYRARRFRPDRDHWRGALEFLDQQWALRNERGPDEPLWALDPRVVRPGGYLALRRPDAEEAVFRIASIDPT